MSKISANATLVTNNQTFPWQKASGNSNLPWLNNQLPWLAGGMSKNFPIEQFSCTNGVYGSVGHAEIHTSRNLLVSLGIDIYALASSSQGYTELYINVVVDGASTRIFGGEYINAKFEYDSDLVIITARDFSGILVDQKRILATAAAGIVSVLAPGQVSALAAQTVNTKLSAVITAIGSAYGFTTVFNPAPSADSNLVNGVPDPLLGTLYGSDVQTFLSVPQSLWAILNQLARDTGYEVYVTAKKQLVFGQSGFGADGKPLSRLTLNYNAPIPHTQSNNQLLPWQQPPLPWLTGGSIVPCRALSIEHNPRRNKTFRVLVLSYDPGKGQQVSGQAIALGTNLVSSNSTYQPGVWGPANYQAITSALAADNIQVPIYTFHQDGLTQNQANARALAIANDIKRRELILSAVVDGIPTLLPTSMIKMAGAIESEISGATFYVGSYTHNFRMPRGIGGSDDGFTTRISAWNIPEPGVGVPVKKTSATVGA